MRIVNRQPEQTADISGARGTAFAELRRLLLFVAALAVAAYLLVGLLTDLAVSRISVQAEARLFGHLSFLPEAGAADDSRLERPRRLLDALVRCPEVPALPYRLVLIDDATPNAFAFPGGTIGLTSGLLDALDEDIALAFVLGHELGHFRHRDHLRGVGRALGFGTACALLFGGGSGAEALGSAMHLALQRGYSRGQEVAADRFGVLLVHRVHGRTDGVDQLFKILGQEETNLPGWAYMLSTHPAPGERIRDLAEYAAELP